MFQIKNFISIVASMVNHIRATTTKLTDFNVGSVVRTMLEAVAIELDQLYQQLVIGLQQAIPTAIFTSFNFTLLPANSASGSMQANFTSSSSNIDIPLGSVITRPDGAATYTVQADTVLLAGNTTVTVPIVCTVSGTIGNLAAGVALSFSQPPTNFLSATSAAALINGAAVETATARKARFIQYVSTLSRGTLAAINYALLNLTYLTDVNGNITEKVAFASVIEPYSTDTTQPVGLVNCYIHNGVGGTSSALVSQAANIINGYTNPAGTVIAGYKSAGIHATYAAATENPLAVTGTIAALPGYVVSALDALATAAVTTYLLGLAIGQTADRNRIIQIVEDIPGVDNFLMSAPAADTTAAIGNKIMPGSLAIA